MAANCMRPTYHNCSVNVSGSTLLIDANPDVSGIGILIGFAASAVLSLLLCTAHSVISIGHASNPVDRMLLPKFLVQWKCNHDEISEAWSEALQNAVLAFSDQQIVTGLAILVSAYAQISCGLQVYHWQIAVDLAFFSSITHLTTLTCLRDYFRKRKSLRSIRLIFMAAMGIMLTVALVTTGYEVNTASIAAWCLFQTNSINDETKSSYNWLYMCVVLSYLTVSYISRAVQLFPRSTSWRSLFLGRISYFARTWLRSLRQRALDSRSLLWVIAHNLLLSVYCPGKAAVDLYESVAVEITWLSLAIVWGTIAVLQDRNELLYDKTDPDATQRVISEQNAWSFGQTVPVVLLLLPLLALVEVSYGALKKYLKTLKTDNSGPTLFQRTFTPLQSPVPANDYDGLYNCSWFRKMTLFIYLSFLSIAADVLEIFPYGHVTNLLTRNRTEIAISYLQWIGLDIAMVWIFSIVALHWPIWNCYFSSSHGHGPDSQALIELMLPHQDIAYFTTFKKTKGGKKWYILILLGLSTSEVFHVYLFNLWNIYDTTI